MNPIGISSNRIKVEPNGVDLNFMYPRDQQTARRNLGLGADDFVVVFVGANEDRKGPKRLLAAIQDLNDVKCILAGQGTGALEARGIVWKGACPHSMIPDLLSCADVFVLPTTGEGSCNAVIEAMACGLPIVTSDGRYMDDIVDDEVAIRADPMDVRMIREAITMLKNDSERQRRMSEASLRKAKCFDINERAIRVTQWIEDLVAEHRSRHGALGKQ